MQSPDTTPAVHPAEAQFLAAVVAGGAECCRLANQAPAGLFGRADLGQAWDRVVLPLAADGRLCLASFAVGCQACGLADVALEIAGVLPATNLDAVRGWGRALSQTAHARGIAALTAATSAALAAGTPPEVAGNSLASGVAQLAAQYGQATDATTAAAVDEWEAWRQTLAERRRQKHAGFGIPEIDRHAVCVPSYGLICARTNHGKTALALQCALGQARAGTPVLFASLEQPRWQVVTRVVCLATGLPWSVVTGTERNPTEAAAIAVVLEWLRGTDRLTIMDGQHTPDSVLSAAARLRQHGRCDAVYVDQMSRLDHRQQPREPKEQAWSRSSRRFQRGWQELGVPLVLVAQLNLKEGTEHPEPQLSHLRDCGSMADDADWVLLIDRPEAEPERFAKLNEKLRKLQHTDQEAAHRLDMRGRVRVSCCKDRTAAMGGTWDECLSFDARCGRIGRAVELPRLEDQGVGDDVDGWARQEV